MLLSPLELHGGGAAASVRGGGGVRERRVRGDARRDESVAEASVVVALVGVDMVSCVSRGVVSWGVVWCRVGSVGCE